MVAEVRPDLDSLDNYLMVQHISEEFGGSDDGDINEFHAESYLYERGVLMAPIRVAQVMRDPKRRPAPLMTLAESDIKNWDNVMSRNHERNPLQVCPFHSCAPRGCNVSESNCKWAHVKRSSNPCLKGGGDSNACSNGPWCPNRHKGDIYYIWFRDRTDGRFKKYEWKDYMSDFSVHCKSRKASNPNRGR